MNDTNFSFTVSISMFTLVMGVMIGILFYAAFKIDDYLVLKQDWKCEKTVIINDDITKVECVNYIKKEK